MGKMGQVRFGELCFAGGLVPNESLRDDRMGWDYLVEFPLSHERGDVSFDRRQKLPDAKIQVKTIWSDRSSIDLALPAAERLALWDYPSFIVILHMNADQTYQSIYLIHLIDDNLARIIKSLRQAEAKGSLSIKNKTISFGIKRGTKIAVDGHELARALRLAIGESAGSYAERKRTQIKGLGFETRPSIVTFSISANNESELLDGLLGLRDLPITGFEADEVRFGISLPQIRETGGGILKVKPQSHGVCEFSMASIAGERKRVVLEANLYTATTSSNSQAPWKMKIESPLIELILASDAPTASIRIGALPGTNLTVRDLIRISRAELIASGPWTASININGKRLLSIDFKEGLETSHPKELTSRIEFLAELDGILQELDLANTRLNEEDIRTNFGQIQFILDSRRAGNEIEFLLEMHAREDASPLPDECEGLFASTLIFPDVTIAFWALIQASMSPREGSVAVRCSKFSLREIARLDAGQTFDEFVAAVSEANGLSFVLKVDRVREQQA
jgi:hypothetical protein